MNLYPRRCMYWHLLGIAVYGAVWSLAHMLIPKEEQVQFVMNSMDWVYGLIVSALAAGFIYNLIKWRKELRNAQSE